MNQPPLDSLLEKIPNKYTLVVKTAKKARQIMEEEIIDENETTIMRKPVTLALFDIVKSTEDSNEPKEEETGENLNISGPFNELKG